jgi:hypothetical protein
MAIIVSALWIFIREVDDSGIDGPEPTSTAAASPEASPTVAPLEGTPPGEGTPDVDELPDWRAGSLPAMLELAPDRLADDSLPLNDIARYADIAAWMAAAGLPTPASLDDPALVAWEAELDNLTIPLSLRERGLDPVWQRTYGFDLTQVGQVLIIGQAPDYVMILRGNFDPEELQTAWVASGYQAVEVEGQTIWSLFPGDTIDLSAQESRPAMGAFNNVVMLEDGTLVAAARMSRLGSVLDVVNDDAPTLAEHDDIAALMDPATGIEDLVSAVISKGSLLQGIPASMPIPASPVTASPAASPEATPTDDAGMPEVNLVLLGVPLVPPDDDATPAPESTSQRAMTIMLVFDSDDDARQARAEIESRLGQARSPVTGQGYGGRLAGVEAIVLDQDDRAIVILSGELVQGTADWLDMLSDRDLGFLFWLPEE